MTSNGKDVLAALEQVRCIFQEMARFLQSADFLMDQAGWSQGGGSYALQGASTSLLSPEKWMPDHVFRLYRADSRRQLLGAISIVFSGNYKFGDGTPIPEPIAYGLVLEYPDSASVPNKQDKELFKLALWHGKVAGRLADGVVRTTALSATENAQAVRASTWCVPLIQVSDSNALRDLIVSKFVAEIADTSA